MSRPDLSIIIVNWNVRECILRALAAIPAAITTAYTYEIIVVDNASSDSSVEAIQRGYADVRVIANPSNHLYTAAANQGLTAASGRHLLLLNPDTDPQPESLARLLAYADAHPQVGLVGPRILDAAGADDLRTGRHYPTPWSETLDWLGLTRRFPHSRLLAANLRPLYQRNHTATVPLLSGACLLLSQHLSPDLRRLDSAYPMYAEDVDLSRRIQAGGYQTVLLAESAIVHHGGESSRQVNRQSMLLAVAGINHYFQIWHGSNAALRHRLGMAIVAAVKGLVFLFLGAFGRREDAAVQVRLHAALLRWALTGRLRQDAVRIPIDV